MKSTKYFTFSIILLFCSIYALMGMMQAASLFSGERALANANIWGSASISIFLFSIFCFWREIKTNKSYPPSPAINAFLGLAILIFGIWFIHPVIKDLIAIDQCLDDGGSFNHVLSICDFSKSHPNLSHFNRQGFRITVFALSFLFSSILSFPYFHQKATDVE